VAWVAWVAWVARVVRAAGWLLSIRESVASSRPRDTIAVIINPISGTGGRPEVARQRIGIAAAVLKARGLDARIVLTEHAGHAPPLARAALDAGVSLVVAWGGDGTINEVATELAFRDAALGIVPSGSGNGLARELCIPFDPAAAFAVAFEGRDRVIDAGEIDGRMFFNIAGLGLDARVAHEFASNGLLRRGFRRYLTIAARELFTFEPDVHTISADGTTSRSTALLIALANGRQYGNGALIAPHARLDDGRLDVVVVAHRSAASVLMQVPLLFAGRIAALPGVTMTTAVDVEITSARPAVYHVDGEPFVGGASLKARALPRALRVRVP
jgi:YegS/Rv2252/BmrU family lipid kinase